MAKGQVWPAEWSEYRDRVTGFPVRRIVHRPPYWNAHFYFHDPAFTLDGRWYVFASNRGGRNELFGMRMEGGELVQLTDCGVAGGWVSARGPRVYYWSGQQVRVLEIQDLREHVVGEPRGSVPQTSPSENADGSLVAFVGKSEQGHEICTMRVADGQVNAIWRTAGRPAHLQCSPVDPDLLMHCDSTIPDGRAKHRIWLISADGKRHWHPYTETPQEWLTHESWLGRTGRLLTTYWPSGVLEMNPDGSGLRLVARINAWYAAASPDGTYCVVNTNFPDRGIHLVEMATGRMCLVHSPCNAPIEPGRVQPTPTFTPDGGAIVFGSEWQGAPSIYLMEVAPALEAHDRWWTPNYRWERW